MNNRNLSAKEMLELAFKNHKENNFKVAENYYLKILKVQPDHYDSIFLLGTLFFQMKNYEDAVKMLAKAIKINPRNINSYQNLGVALIEMGKTVKAVEVLSKASEIKPDHSGIMYNLGNAFKELGKFEEAVNCYENTIKLEPKNTKAYNNLGNALKQLRRNEKAIETFKKAIEIDPKHVSANHNIANTYKEIGSFKKSKEYYKKSFEFTSNLESLHSLSELDNTVLDQNVRDKIDKIMNQKEVNDNNIAYGKFVLSKYEKKENNFKKEFEFLLEGHRQYFLSQKKMFEKGVNYWLNQLPEFKELIDFNVDIKNKENSKIKPIFIVGVPRSGSTLIEKVIGSGPNNIPMGEEIGIFNFLMGEIIVAKKTLATELENLSNSVIKMYNSKQLINKENEYVFTDKTLDNFFFVNLIKKIFPNSKFINCKRKPSSSIMSIIRNNLGAVSWAHNLEHIFKYFDIYYNKIEFYKKKYPKLIYDIELENFVSNPEIEAKKLIQYCELPWDKKCLEFYKRKDLVSRTASNIQIRKAIFSSSDSENEVYRNLLKDFGKKYSWFN